MKDKERKRHPNLVLIGIILLLGQLFVINI
jgi:hypothetical protein